ncbi:hypothetical protein BB560_006902 [Smittium megazygosporum]|uniref:chitin synthase n=1 Tax=Smittium megazygosporum TaxID=133381 RepID=A0A2T9Y0B6_9FUNG|nr:hypothetical protein BB560_006902 [Smittium megazygosporum]
MAQEPSFDLSKLSDKEPLSSDKIEKILKDRAQDDSNPSVYTKISERFLLAVNYYPKVSTNDDSVIQEYIDNYRNTNLNPLESNPHIFDLVTKCHFYMKQTGLNQSIIFMGESGSGKTESKRLAIKVLSYLRWQSKRDMSIYDKVIDSQTVIEAFTHAKTHIHANASRVGTYTELYFDPNGRIMGSQIFDYMFDRARTTRVFPNERNYHIFYYLFYGASHSERHSLGLTQSHYEYLDYPETVQRLVGIDDKTQFNDLKQAMKTLGLGEQYSKLIFQTLSTILLLGNIQFEDPKDSTVVENMTSIKNEELLEQVASFLGVDPVDLANSLIYKSELIGTEMCTIFLDAAQAHQRCNELATLLYSLLVKWMIFKINSNLKPASSSLENGNGKEKEDVNNSNTAIGLLDIPGSYSQGLLRFEEFLFNYINERIIHFMNHQIFEIGDPEFTAEGLEHLLKPVEYKDNSRCLDLFMWPKTGLFSIIRSENRHFDNLAKNSELLPNAVKDMAITMKFSELNSKQKNSYIPINKSEFGIKHYNCEVSYTTEGFFESNSDKISLDFINLLNPTGSHYERIVSPVNQFISNLFDEKFVISTFHPKNKNKVIEANQILTPLSVPLTANKKDKSEYKKSGSYAVGSCQKSVSKLISAIDNTLPWFVININSNEKVGSSNWDSETVQNQIDSFGIPQIAFRRQLDYSASLSIPRFLDRYAKNVLDENNYIHETSELQKCESIKLKMGFPEHEMAIGKTRVFLSYVAWHKLESLNVASSRMEQLEEGNEGNTNTSDGNDVLSVYSDDENANVMELDENDDNDLKDIVMKNKLLSQMLSNNKNNTEFYPIQEEMQEMSPEMNVINQLNSYNYQIEEQGGGITTFDQSPKYDTDKINENQKLDSSPDQNAPLVSTEKQGKEKKKKKTSEKKKMSMVRRNWLIFVWLVTWWVPSPILSTVFRIKNSEQRIAWREKFTLCFLIALVCMATIFWIAIFGVMICPKQYVYSIEELNGYNSADNALISIRGEVFSIKDFNHLSVSYKYLVDNNYPGKDLSDKFPLQLSFVCSGMGIDPRLAMSPMPLPYSDTWLHDQRYWKHPEMLDNGGYNYYQYRIMRIMRMGYLKGKIGLDPSVVHNKGSGVSDVRGQKRYLGIINQEVFDLSDYINYRGAPYSIAPKGVNNNTDVRTFLDTEVVNMFSTFPGTDLTSRWEAYFADKPDLKKKHYNCLRGAFFAGVIDKRKSFQCYFANYILLASSVALTSIILFKFLAALQLSSLREPEERENFVICNVPCYTEGEDSLRSTLDSLARLSYDDKRKLIFVVCDGMIMGAGNDRTTPQIVLDILGADKTLHPEPLSYLALGEGQKQHNMAKVYTGLYEVSGHVVPYIVVVKCGNQYEKIRQGNRGKRDSQIILMRFFNKVFFELEMTPLELEIYHQIKNIIGVDPVLYEFVMMVDADTYVFPDSLNRMVSCMINDTKLMGICGETKLANEKETWITMIQVYEYYISHHLSKAFESLFGSVTCLPGCFCMYRLRSAEKNYPLLINSEIIKEYSENNVDTLHKKNLLHLGEDRYLTTLMLKHLPYYKTKFTPDAQCRTNAPDTWSILLSQRRRWINSTVHNLLELVFLPRLCGFCCFSMRFIVFIDLLSTIIMPATVAYLVYLIYVLVTWESQIPMVSICLLVSVYAMQCLLFIIKKQWQHIGWMVVYIFAMPVFAFFIPIYSFWHFDDFSWGNTRRVVGDKNKKNILTDTEAFDEDLIPKKKWAEYEKDALNDLEVDFRSRDETPVGVSARENVFSNSRVNSPAFSLYSNLNYGYNGNMNNVMLRSYSPAQQAQLNMNAANMQPIQYLMPYVSPTQNPQTIHPYSTAQPHQGEYYNMNYPDYIPYGALDQNLMRTVDMNNNSINTFNGSGLYTNMYPLHQSVYYDPNLSQNMIPIQNGMVTKFAQEQQNHLANNNMVDKLDSAYNQAYNRMPPSFNSGNESDPIMVNGNGNGMQQPNTVANDESNELYKVIKDIIAESDLSKLTKKAVRKEVAARMNFDQQEMKEKKQQIDGIIEKVVNNEF